jgi:hypothetical protein
MNVASDAATHAARPASGGDYHVQRPSARRAGGRRADHDGAPTRHAGAGRRTARAVRRLPKPSRPTRVRASAARRARSLGTPLAPISVVWNIMAKSASLKDSYGRALGGRPRHVARRCNGPCRLYEAAQNGERGCLPPEGPGRTTNSPSRNCSDKAPRATHSASSSIFQSLIPFCHLERGSENVAIAAASAIATKSQR